MRRIKLLKHHQTICTKVLCDLSQTLDWIVLIHEHEAADNCVKRLIERHYSGIAYDKTNVDMVAAYCARFGPLYCFRRSIYPKDVPVLSDQSAAKKLTSPLPLPTSRTRIPGFIPA